MLDFETFLITLYVEVDTFCQTMPPPPRRPGPRSSLHRSEVLTLGVLAQWPRFVSERDFYRYAVRHLRSAFPGLPDRSQFNRLLRQQQRSLAQFAVWFSRATTSLYEILDGVPLPTRTHQRSGRGWLPGIANIGRHPRLGWYTGLRLLLAITPEGRITAFGVGPASANDRHLTETLLALRQTPDPYLPSVGGPGPAHYLADTGFGGVAQVTHWFSHYGVTVTCPPQRDSHRHWSGTERYQMSRRRQLVETAISRLLDTFGLRTERPHRLDGFLARLAAKIALYNFAIHLNQRRARPLLTFADLIDW